MEHPVKEINHVITQLCTAPPSQQMQTLNTYFTPNAAFTHPLCRVPSFGPIPVPYIGTSIDSRTVIACIYRWYKILSPTIGMQIHSAVFDQKSSKLYVHMSQDFTLFFLPLAPAHASLTTVLTLSQQLPPAGPNNYTDEIQAGLVQAEPKYYIQHQEDLYQTSEFMKFPLPWGGFGFVYLLQIFATFLSVLGAIAGLPVTLLQERSSRQAKKSVKNGI